MTALNPKTVIQKWYDAIGFPACYDAEFHTALERYAIDPTKLETELGWKPKYTFETGIKQTIQWYLDNKEWWQNIISGEYANYFDKMYGKELAE